MKSTSFQAYALLGSGRLARHLHCYLQQLSLPFRMWSRNADPAFNSHREFADSKLRLAKTLEGSTHVLLAVKDSALSNLSQEVQGEGRRVIHFSGALHLPGTPGAHPLMTFGEGLESLDWYSRIPFVIDPGPAFENLLPGFPNPHFVLTPEQKPLYHALCSLAGNSTFLLWRKILFEFQERLDLPAEILAPYLHQVVNNAVSGGALNFTGPVARGDWRVIRSHLEVLSENRALKEVYQSYLKMAASSGYPIPAELSP